MSDKSNGTTRTEGEPAARPSLAIVQPFATQFDVGCFRRIVQSGIDLTVYYTHPDPIKPALDPEVGVESGWDFDLASGYSWKKPAARSGWSYAKEIVRGGHDYVIVSGYTQRFPLLVGAYGRWKRVPVGVRSDSILQYKRAGWKTRLKAAVLPLLLRVFRAAHPTGSLASAYLTRYGVPAARQYFFPYAVDSTFVRERFERARTQRAELRAALNIPADAPVAMGALKFVDREDPLTLVRGFLRVREAVPEARLVLVGEGQLRPEIENLLAGSDRNFIRLTGYVPYTRLIELFAIADVFVHPAVLEQWGVSVNEALLCELPVLAAESVGSAADLIVGRETGQTFRTGDDRDLAEKLIPLLNHPSDRALQGGRGPKVVEEWGYDLTVREVQRAMKEFREKR